MSDPESPVRLLFGNLLACALAWEAYYKGERNTRPQPKTFGLTQAQNAHVRLLVQATIATGD